MINSCNSMEEEEEDCHSEESEYKPNSDGIPIDLFLSKKKQLTRGGLKLTDSDGNLVFSVHRSHSHHLFNRILADSSGTPLIYIAHNLKATWHGYRKDSSEEKDIMFRAERTMNTFNKVEFEVLLNNANPDDPKKSIFKMRGSPFYRSCTIYNGETIVAQTSLMYKLGIRNVIVPRNKFRLTIFPGYADRDFVVALTVIFFYGRKLWI
ncbi:protein LURP-one-related 7-like [Rutidosis leptorrhynchoides]|uniref:protein LURP-one-related 7-like n=1 Tax=Rutidosis leptorrhynchoides TaxID=125765 RepID=UPI003A991E2D